jgi:ATP-dependent Lon protease
MELRRQRNIVQLKYSTQEKQYYNKLTTNNKEYIKKYELIIFKNNIQIVPYRFQIFNLPISCNEKTHLINKYEMFTNLDQTNPEYHKYQQYFNTLFKIPFNNYHKISKNLFNNSNEINSFLSNSKNILDTVIYGNNNIKNYILQILSIFITNSSSSPAIFGITGPMGVGKTTIIKEGLSRCLNNRPIEFINLGGLSDASYFDGHSFTYEGSKYGKFVEILIKHQVMNPIIYFDELDKLSQTEKGIEIMDLLIHITDPVQNNKFMDKYISDINIDLSKCIFVFTYNNKEKINPILLDRIHELQIYDYKLYEKNIIINKYILPSIYSEICIDTSKFKLQKNIINYIFTKYANNSVGLRTIKKILFDLFSKINMLIISNLNWKLLNIKNNKNYKFPIYIDTTLINILLN